MKERKSVLCVGLVCLDLVTVVDKFPKEDTDMRSSAQYKVTSPPKTKTKSLLKGNTPLSRSVEGTRTTAAGFSQSLVSQQPSLAVLLARCTLHHLPAPWSTFFSPSCTLQHLILWAFMHLVAPYLLYFSAPSLEPPSYTLSSSPCCSGRCWHRVRASRHGRGRCPSLLGFTKVITLQLGSLACLWSSKYLLMNYWNFPN